LKKSDKFNDNTFVNAFKYVSRLRSSGCCKSGSCRKTTAKHGR